MSDLIKILEKYQDKELKCVFSSDYQRIAQEISNICTCMEEPMWLVGGKCVACNKPRLCE